MPADLEVVFFLLCCLGVNKIKLYTKLWNLLSDSYKLGCGDPGKFSEFLFLENCAFRQI